MNPLDHDAFLTSGPRGPDEDDGPDYACTQEQWDAVNAAYEAMDSLDHKHFKAMPNDARRYLIDAKDWLIDWMNKAEEQGIEPSENDKQCRKYGV